MKKISTWISTHSVLILIISAILIIPAVIGFITTRINYDVLVYLPDNIDTIKGQDILTNDFGIGAYAFIMSDKDNPKEIKELEEELKKVDTVNEVVSVVDVTNGAIPLDILPDDLVQKLKSNKSTLIMVTLSDSTSSDVTLKAIEDIRKVVKDAWDAMQPNNWRNGPSWFLWLNGLIDYAEKNGDDMSKVSRTFRYINNYAKNNLYRKV